MTTRRPAPATDGCTLLLGAVLLFQGAGRLTGAERSWFVTDHLYRLGYLDFLGGNEIVGYVAFAVAGLAVLIAANTAVRSELPTASERRAGLAAGSRCVLGAGDPRPDQSRE